SFGREAGQLHRPFDDTKSLVDMDDVVHKGPGDPSSPRGMSDTRLKPVFEANLVPLSQRPGLVRSHAFCGTTGSHPQEVRIATLHPISLQHFLKYVVDGFV